MPLQVVIAPRILTFYDTKIFFPWMIRFALEEVSDVVGISPDRLFEVDNSLNVSRNISRRQAVAEGEFAISEMFPTHDSPKGWIVRFDFLLNETGVSSPSISVSGEVRISLLQ